MKISVQKILTYLCIISASLGILGKLFGIWPMLVFLFLRVLADISNPKKVYQWRNVVVLLGLLMLFIYIKCIPIENYVAISSYHSVITFVKRMVYLFAGLLFYLMLDDRKEFEDVKVKKTFISCYYFSVILSIFILAIKGTHIYREDVAAGGIFLAPQYYLFYAIGFAILNTYYVLKDKNKRGIRILFLVINVIYIIMANYTTQIIFTFIGIGMVLLLHIVKKISKLILSLAIIIAVPFLFADAFSEVLLTMNDSFFSNNAAIYMRVSEISQILKGEADETYAFKVRTDLIGSTFATFEDNKLLGIGFNNYNTEGAKLNVGGHSQWIDDLARLGIIGMIVWICMLWRNIKDILICKKKLSDFEKLYVIIYFLYGFLNPFISLEFIYITYYIVRIEQDEEREIAYERKVVYHNGVGIQS